jgi:benzoyl-CoA reductase subunit C
MKPYDSLISDAKALAFDLQFAQAREWKSVEKTRVLVGYTPVYFPREIIHACHGLPVGIMGAGDGKQIIKGDAYYQSYICHMPRGIVEMALDHNLDHIDGFVFPAICDVMRNLSGMFKMLNVGKFSKYFDLPQNFKNGIGDTFYISEMKHVMAEIKKINGVAPTSYDLNHAIKLYNDNRKLLQLIYDIRQKYPWRMSFEDLYYVIRAGMVIPVAEHNTMLNDVLGYLSEERGEPMDKIKVVVSGAFCEQPPIGLIKTIENAGCYIVDDDFLIGSRWIQGNIAEDTKDPLQAIANAYLKLSTFSSCVYDVDNHKGPRLVDQARMRNADGVIFASPSFCDPALLDCTILQNACSEANLRFISFLYSENTGQFKVIKEQVGAFSDSIKLWEDETILAS